ncbi:MAG: purine-nucleoside phosphorylase [Neisseriaceae bacterium]
MNIISSDINNKIMDITNFILSKSDHKAEFGLILGSGLGESLANTVEDKTVIPYKDIPHLPNSTAPGHAGNLILGKLGGRNFIIMQGRLHIYEGHSPADATLLIRAMKLLGVEKLFITCAAGGLNGSFNVGDIMLITDHINFSGTNPLIGENLNNFGARFPSMFDIYTPELQEIAYQAAKNININLCRGVYASILGPLYATRAELQFLINNHCDAIGMSVVQEAIVAAHSGMQILGLAAITDMALPYSVHHATQDDVLNAAYNNQTKFKFLILEIINKLYEYGLVHTVKNRKQTKVRVNQ